MRKYFSLLFWGVVAVIVIFLINLPITFIGYTIVGVPTTFNQLIRLIIFVVIGVSLYVYFLPLLDKYYKKSFPSLIAFIVEYGIYGIFLSFLVYFVYNFAFFPNILINMAGFSMLVILPVFGHEFGHFLFAYLRGYNPVLIPLRLVDHFVKDYVNPTSQTLALTLFHGKPSRLIYASGPLMNFFLCVFGIYLMMTISFGEHFEVFVWMFIFYNGLLFFYNINELFSS